MKVLRSVGILLVSVVSLPWLQIAGSITRILLSFLFSSETGVSWRMVKREIDEENDCTKQTFISTNVNLPL